MFPHTHTTHISKRKRDRDHTQHSPNGGRDLGKEEKTLTLLGRNFPSVSQREDNDADDEDASTNDDDNTFFVFKKKIIVLKIIFCFQTQTRF